MPPIGPGGRGVFDLGAGDGVPGAVGVSTGADLNAEGRPAGSELPNMGFPAAPRAPAGWTPPAITLVDRALEAGIDCHWKATENGPLNVLETMGQGVALLDFDQDGWLDVLCLGVQPKLLRNRKGGRFQPMAAGLEKLPKARYTGVAVGDYDLDGFPDLYLSAYRGGVLLHNDQGRALRDVTVQAGIPVQPWGSAVSFADLDQDGRPDLIVGNYLKYDRSTALVCQTHGISHLCPPWYYSEEKPRVYRNVDGRFQDVTAAWGFNASAGKNLGVVVADLDRDGRVEVVFGNDMVPGDLFKWNGTRFENEGIISGTAYDEKGLVHGGMGIDVGDFDRDGRLDMVVGTFELQGASLYHGMEHGQFKDQSFARGVGQATWPYVTFGTRFVDLDNDGWPEVFLINGHLLENVHALFPHTSYEQSMVLLYNLKGQFVDLSSRLTKPAARKIVGRGMAVGDIDQDGRIDILAVDDMGRMLYLHNETPAVGHRLSIRLLDRSGHEALGATVQAQLEGKPLVAAYHADGSYYSASDPRLHLGLGAVTSLSELSVRWPDGQLEQFGPLAADRRVELREGSGRAVKAAGGGGP